MCECVSVYSNLIIKLLCFSIIMVTEVNPFLVVTMIGVSLASRLVTQTTRTGVRCIIYNGKNFVSDTEEYRHCVIRCMHKGCPYFNYNIVEKFCQLGDEGCVSLVLDNQYNLTSFVSPVKSCVEWIPAADSDTSHMIRSSTCHSVPPYITCFVGRLISGLHILPGSYRIGVPLYTSLNGQGYTSGQKEVLTVGAGCQVGWIPYVAGNVIPTRAVVGGFLASGTGFTLFVIRGQANGYTLFGYYNPNAQNGYVEIDGVHVLTEMEMLVEV